MRQQILGGEDGTDGSFPVKCDLIEKVIEGAQLIKVGKAEGSPVNIFGNEVVLYKFPYAGLLCEK